MSLAVLGRARWLVPLLFNAVTSLACSDDVALVDSAPVPGDATADGKPDAGLDLPPVDAARIRPDGRPNVGHSCKTDQDCTAELTCDSTLPGGMCTSGCKTDAQCTGDDLACHAGRCHSRCNSRAPINPCRDRYVCRLEGKHGVCVPDCRDLPCTKGGWLCDVSSGQCVDPTSGTLGAPCGATLGSCEGRPNGVCLSLNTFSGSFCSVPCAPFTMPCPTAISGARCIGGPPSGPLCVFLCDPKKPRCPHAKLSCQGPLPGGYNVCLP